MKDRPCFQRESQLNTRFTITATAITVVKEGFATGGKTRLRRGELHAGYFRLLPL